MNCPETEVLISFAMGKSGDKDPDIASHIASCAHCRGELKIINETLLADEWGESCGDVNVSDVLKLQPRSPSSDAFKTPHVPDEMSPYRQIAQEDTTDRFGNYTIAKGSTMIIDPGTNERMLATSENIKEFIANGFSFVKKCPSGFLAAEQNLAKQFGAALDVNVRSLKGKLIPDLNLPVKVNFMPWPIRFKKIQEIKTDHLDWIAYLEKQKVIPDRTTMSESGWSKCVNANLFRVYDVSWHDIVVRVFSIFVTPVNGDTGLVEDAGIVLYNKVIGYLEQWKRQYGGREITAKCFSFGTAKVWDKTFQPVLLSDSIQVFSAPSNNVEFPWLVKHRALDGSRKAYLDFVSTLWPETREDQITRVRTLLKSGRITGSMDVCKVATYSGIPKQRVLEIFECLYRDKSERWWCSTVNKVNQEPAIEWKEDGNKGKHFVYEHLTWQDWVMIVLTASISFGPAILMALLRMAGWQVGLVGSFTFPFGRFVYRCYRGYRTRKLKE